MHLDGGISESGGTAEVCHAGAANVDVRTTKKQTTVPTAERRWKENGKNNGYTKI